MANIDLIISKIDEYLEKNNLIEIKAVEAAEILDRAGVLKDSTSRPGLPLRNLLRANKIPNVRFEPYQRDKWYIYHS